MNRILVLWWWLLRIAAGEQEVKILPPLRAVTNGRAGLRPHHARTAEVHNLLDEAPEGAEYKELVLFIRERSGKGCSMRTIRAWKKRQK